MSENKKNVQAESEEEIGKEKRAQFRYEDESEIVWLDDQEE